MKKYISFRLIFNRHNRLNKDGAAPIVIKAYYKGVNKYISTGIHIVPKQWSDKACRVKNHVHQEKLNTDLQSLIATLDAAQMEHHKIHGFVAINILPDPNATNAHQLNFFEFYAEQMHLQNAADVSVGTYNQTLDKLKNCFPRPLYLSELNFKNLQVFDKYLTDKGFSVNTKAKHHKNVKKFINLAIKHDLLDINKNPYKKFTVKSEDTNRVYLLPYELANLEALQLPDDRQHYKLIVDFFLFLCYTGLRYSDATALTPRNFTDTPDGWIMKIKSQKTNEHQELNLRLLFPTSDGEALSRPERIIHHYIKHQDDFLILKYEGNAPLFHGLTNQHFNREIKEVMQLIACREEAKAITLHGARHTFANILQSKTKNQKTVQYLLGHRDPKTTALYLHKNRTVIEEELAKTGW
jgi:integrase